MSVPLASDRTARRHGATRLGAVSYLNTRPLVYGLEDRRDILLRFDVPARCADLLEGGLIDLGLIPAFEYARRGSYRIVPGVAIASRGAVDSVALFTRRPIAEVRTIALDTSSRTSANLVRLLSTHAFHIAPTFRPAAPALDAMLATADAALLIGDPALFADPVALGVTKIDLGTVWTELTGLPFVWAFWAGPAEAASPEVCRLLAETRDRGVAAIDAIGRREAPGDERRARRIAAYLRESIVFDLDRDAVRGLTLYFEMLAGAGLVAEAAPLHFFASA